MLFEPHRHHRLTLPLELVCAQEMVHNIVGRDACPQRVITFHKVAFFSHITIFHRTFASSAPSAIVPQLTHQFGFSGEVGTLTISLFVAGYCIGPILWGPLSEQYGRRPIFLIAFLVYTASERDALC